MTAQIVFVEGIKKIINSMCLLNNNSIMFKYNSVRHKIATKYPGNLHRQWPKPSNYFACYGLQCGCPQEKSCIE